MENSLQELLNDNFLNKIPSIDELLIFCTENKCSDLYIKIGEQPFVSRYGKIYTIPSYKINFKIWDDWSKTAITSENNAKYVRQKMLDMSYVVYLSDDHIKDLIKKISFSNNKLQLKQQNDKPKSYRYRVSCGFSMGKNIATFRMISAELPSFSTINFPKNASELLYKSIEKRNKITLFIGATGSGKTTSMVACLNDFSKNNGPLCNSTIISLEDPIEYVMPSSNNVNVIQKELGTDFKEFSSGVKQALREHPNFINVGETRDSETIETLVEASRTGHGVISSFHATDVGDTLSRMYNYLIKDNESIMYDLVNNINFIICQKLKPSDNGFILNTQWMMFTEDITKFLIKNIEQGKNIPTVVNSLFKNQELLKYNIVKDWE